MSALTALDISPPGFRILDGQAKTRLTISVLSGPGIGWYRCTQDTRPVWRVMATLPQWVGRIGFKRSTSFLGCLLCRSRWRHKETSVVRLDSHPSFTVTWSNDVSRFRFSGKFSGYPRCQFSGEIHRQMLNTWMTPCDHQIWDYLTWW
jgi:hypothetical protein